MGLTYQEAYDATDPSLTDDERKASAERIISGALANSQYWDHRSELEAVKAEATGHGVIARGPDEEGEDKTLVSTEHDAVGTAEEERPTPLSPAPDNPNETVARLRQQLRDSGHEPEA